VLLRQTNKRQTRSSALARPGFVHLAKVRMMLKSPRRKFLIKWIRL
jgi:hypothetical protein